MKLWEAMKELTENPEKVFERNDRYKTWTLKTDYKSNYDVTYYFILECEGQDSYGDAGRFSGNLASNEEDWEEAKQSVPWQEAFQAWIDGKSVVCEYEEKYTYSSHDGLKYDEMVDQCGDGVDLTQLRYGTWYVE